MPPKKSAKNEQKAKQKIDEDKTFGLKNKNKSAKVNKYVQQVQQAAMSSGSRKEQKEREDRKAQSEAKKRAEEIKKAELADLFKPVQIQQKVPFGVDPKTILCQFFKANQCQKGSKCKFSHDLNIERKSTKIDIYADARDTKKDELEKEKDTMDDWDQNKLEQVIESKHIKDNKNKPTEIVCKFFLEAIENRKYGWFWACPNGGDTCKYRHALPPGFVLKKKETEEERRAREENEKENQITIEDFLETERHNLGPNLTPITYESFMKWKKDRVIRKQEEAAKEAEEKAAAYRQMKAGAKTLGMKFSGKELFEYNPDWAAGENEADDDVVDVREMADSEKNSVAGDSEAVNREELELVDVDEELFNEEELAGLDIDDDDDE